MTGNLLRDHGYNFIGACRADAAMNPLCSGTIHLLPTAVMIRERRPHEAAEQLSPTRPEMKVSFMSDHPHAGRVDAIAEEAVHSRRPGPQGAKSSTPEFAVPDRSVTS